MNEPLLLPLDAHPNIREDKTSPLILIGRKTIYYARHASMKDEMIATINWKRDKLLFAWAGRYSTDVFQLTEVDIKRLYPSDAHPK